MSIPFSGTIKRSGGITAAIYKQLKSVTLKPVKKVVFQFDPFHEKVIETRSSRPLKPCPYELMAYLDMGLPSSQLKLKIKYFLFHISTPYVLNTNRNCILKTQVNCDRSDPTVAFYLGNGDEVLFKSANLTALEMLKLFNKHISILVPKDDLLAEPITTKSTKKKGKKH